MNDEFEWLKKIKAGSHRNHNVIQGIGDDAALLKGKAETNQILCLDTMVEGIHFTKDTMEPFHIGYKALASNISDIAAMGGRPLYYLVSVALSNSWTETELLSIYEGMHHLADTYKMTLLGGDTVSTKDSLVLSITVIGEVEKNRKLLRSNARAGDIVFVTGMLGDSAAGLALLLKHTKKHPFTANEKKLILSHQMPRPHVEEGRLLAGSHSRISLNDISDGIASEANEIAEASGVTLTLFYDRLPKSGELADYLPEQQEQWILNGGEDYILMGTMPREIFRDMQRKFNENGMLLFEVGIVTAGNPEVYLIKNQERILLNKQGYNHFSSW